MTDDCKQKLTKEDDIYYDNCLMFTFKVRIEFRFILLKRQKPNRKMLRYQLPMIDESMKGYKGLIWV